MRFASRAVTWALLLGLPLQLAAQSGVQDFGAQAQGWLNAIRAEKGRAALSVSPALTRAAAAHAADMNARSFFGHDGSDGSSIGDRVRRQGYGFCFAAENIAKGQGSLEQVLQGWRKSKGHRRNMLHSDAREFGLVLGPGNLWVMVLARPGC